MKVALTVSDFLDRAALVHGARIGIYDEPDPPGGGLGDITYARVGELARAQAAALDEMGVGVGERVAIVSQNSARLLTSFFGVSGWGRVLVPINFRLNVEEIRYIVDHSGASVLLVDPELADSLADIDVKQRIVLGAATDGELYREGVEPAAWEADEDATATINYTSGTTARPKGVQITHRNIWVNAATFGWHATVNERDVYLHTLPMFHANGWGMPFATTGMGVPQVVLRKVDGADILRRVEQHGVTLMCGAPAVVSMVLDAASTWDGPIPGAGRTRIVVAGAPPPTKTIERVETELGWEFIQIYGLTETSPLLTMNRGRQEYDSLTPSERAARLGRAGAPAVGVRIKISDQGEVLARSNVVLEGYWEQPEATADALEGGWFHTGDGGSLDDEHHVTIADRKKDVIISGGENVSSIEVEDALFSHPAVSEVCVIGVPDEKWGETVKGLVVFAPGESATEQELIDWCRSRLAHYKCPTSVEFRDELARTATGKLQKFKLRAPYWEGRERQVNEWLLGPLSTRIEDGVAWVTIDHPPINLFDLELMMAFDAASRSLADDDSVRVVVVDSADPDIWIAHADVSLILQMPDADPSPTEVGFFHAIGERFRTMPKATIALIEGVVRGGGAETALGFDMRFGTVGRTVMGFPETLLGIMPGGGGTQRLPRVVGRARALEVILGGLDVDAETAERWGWLNRAFPEGEARPYVEHLARRIASTPALALRVAKESVDVGVAHDPDAGLIREAQLFRTLAWSPEGRQLMQAFLDRDGQSRASELARRHRNAAIGVIRRYIGVYDADGTMVGELSYLLGRAVGRAHCALCDITHGAVRERPSWRAKRSALGAPFVTYHRDDAPDAVLAIAMQLPAVVAEHDDGSLSVVATAEQLESCAGSPDSLVALLRS